MKWVPGRWGGVGENTETTANYMVVDPSKGRWEREEQKGGRMNCVRNTMKYVVFEMHQWGGGRLHLRGGTWVSYRILSILTRPIIGRGQMWSCVVGPRPNI